MMRYTGELDDDVGERGGLTFGAFQESCLGLPNYGRGFRSSDSTNHRASG